jgi:ATP-binding cassette subfamily B protein
MVSGERGRLTWERLFKRGRPSRHRRLKDGKSLILSGVRPGEKPQVAILDPLDMKAGFKFLDKEEFEGIWDGTTILIKRIYRLTDEDQPFPCAGSAEIFRERNCSGTWPPRP